MSNRYSFTNTIVWGFTLWFIGYLAGIGLFFVVPKAYIGWVLTPLATILTVLILVRKIRRPNMLYYFGLGVIWTFMAAVLDYIFMVKMFNTGSSYYKPDVFLYYILTFALPLLVGYWKYTRKTAKEELF